MQPDPTKAKYDPIPVLPPGIAPPDTKPAPKPSEPAAAKPSPSPSPSSSPSQSATSAPAVPAWLKGVFAPTKNKGIVAAAATSLFVGWYGLRTVFPPMQKMPDIAFSETDTPTLPPMPTATPEAPLIVTPVAAAPTGFMPSITVPAVDLSNPPTATTPATPPPVAVPLINLENSASAPKPVPFTVPVAGTPEIKPASFDDIKPPAIPTVPVAAPPAATGGSPLPPIVLPDAGTPAGGPPAPIVVPVIPGISPAATPEPAKGKAPEIPPAAIPAVDLSGLGSSPTPLPTPTPVAPPAATPVLTGPSTSVPVVPPASSPAMTVPDVPTATAPAPTAPSPGGVSLVAPDMTFSKPAVPPAPAPVVTRPAVSVTPGPSLSDTSVPRTSTAPTLLPVSGGTPATAAVETKTDFDVDLHYPKPGDSYATISKQHYGDERYARVLEQFNVAAGATGRVVQVPPTWWVKKQTGAPASRPAPAPSKGDEWSAAPSNAIREFVVPASKADGMTFRDIATQIYGSDQEWQRVFDLNPRYSADAVLPPGTKVRVAGNK